MPIYEYECDKCGVTFEAIQAISAKPLKTCKGLGCNDKDDGKVHRLVSASGFILKGSGWYTSEYPSEARKKGWEQESKQGKTDTGGPPVPTSAESSSAKAPSLNLRPRLKNPCKKILIQGENPKRPKVPNKLEQAQ